MKPRFDPRCPACQLGHRHSRARHARAIERQTGPHGRYAPPGDPNGEKAARSEEEARDPADYWKDQ